MDQEDTIAVTRAKKGADRHVRALNEKALRDLLQKDGREILLRLSNEGGGLDELLKDITLKSTILLLFLEAIGKSFTPELLTELPINIADIIYKMIETEFLSQTLYRFIERLTDDEQRRIDSEKRKSALNATVIILRYAMETSPSFAYPKVMYFRLLLQAFCKDASDETFQKNFKKFETLLKKHSTRVEDDREETAGATGGQGHGVRITQDDEQPANNFRELPLIPIQSDLTGDELSLRRNREMGRYASLEDYLDVQFRLFRADLVLPLRDGIERYLGSHDTDAQRGGGRGMRVYHDVQILCPVCTDQDISYRLWFDASRLGPVDWCSSQRLKYGSMVCLSKDNFKSYVCAIVQEQDTAHLDNGLVDAAFIPSPEDMQQVTQSYRDDRYVMVESPAYFEAYRHVLQGLKNLHEQSFPFAQYIVHCNTAVNPPAYLQQGGDVRYNFQPLLNDSFTLSDLTDADSTTDLEALCHSADSETPRASNKREAEVMSGRDWPTSQELKLDDSQYRALKNALTREFAIVQGPPGTGKTYLGLKILKMLLHNSHHWNDADRKRPVLVVCYTNHALDQFLEGILKFFKGTMVRVGARSKSELLKDYNLSSLRVRARENRKVPKEVHEAKIRAKLELRDLSKEINSGAARMEIAEREVVSEFLLEAHISRDHMRCFQRRNKVSAMLTWLKLQNLQEQLTEQAQFNCKKLPPHRRTKGHQAPHRSASWTAAMGDEDQDKEEDSENKGIDISASFRDDNQSRILDDDDDIDYDLELSFILEESENEMEGLNTPRSPRRSQQFDSETLQKSIALSVSNFCKEIEVSLKDRTVARPSKDQNKKVKENFCKLRQQYKRWLQGQLRSTDRMSLDEADKVKDIWKLEDKDRWRLYRLWVDLFCRQIRGEMREMEQTYHTKVKKYREVLYQEDRIILQNAVVLGMTTTGAARYQSILQAIGPRIIIVEEAAEVFEAHVVATLSGECQHVILIGDHKQLRPNPVMHELAKKFNLDLSLFERMIKNEFPYDCLEYQHRMRPEISHMMRLPQLYPMLKDHSVVMNHPPVRGVGHNVYYISHSQPEKRDEQAKSFSNKFEAEFMVALCGYLLKQDYRPEQITILTPYSGQLHAFERLMSRESLEGVRVSSVDNFQGEESDIILLSLVRSNSDREIGFLKMENRMCVALSRAGVGLYVMGNFETLQSGSKLFEDILTRARAQGVIGPGLPLACQNHPRGEPVIACKADDFNKAPEGGCCRPCGVRLSCGHFCPRTCHPATQRDHDSKKCSMTCSAKCLSCGQTCMEKHECSEHTHCKNVVEKIVPRCGHVQMMACGEDPVQFVCQEPCTVTLECGHPYQNACGEMVSSAERAAAVCSEPCRVILACGHTCGGTCGECSRGRLHLACKQKCQKILVCQHECEATCNQCPPCKKPCANKCQHSHCDKPCGQPCVSCRVKCAWQCQHKTCTKPCGEACNRDRCDEPCALFNLGCDHPCIGLCGETCPPFCRICDELSLKEMGHTFGPLKADDRIVLLEDCCHAFEFRALDKWVERFQPTSHTTQKAGAAGKMDEPGFMKIPECPQCKTAIRINLRYGNIIKACLEEIEIIKRRCLGDQETISALERNVQQAASSLPRDLKTQVEATLLSQGGVRCTSQLTAQLDQITLLHDIYQLHRQVSAEKSRWPDKIDMHQTLQADVENFMTWALRPRNVLSTQEVSDARHEFQRLYIVTHLPHSFSDEVEPIFLKRLAEMTWVLTNGWPPTENDLKEGETLAGCRQVFKSSSRQEVSEATGRLPEVYSDKIKELSADPQRKWDSIFGEFAEADITGAGAVFHERGEPSDPTQQSEDASAELADVEKPAFSKRWYFQQEFTTKGGNLQADNSDIVLSVPEAAVKQGSSLIIRGAVYTNLERVHSELGFRDDERIVSPAVEYTVGPEYVFEKPLTITMRHFISGNITADSVCVYSFHEDDTGFHVQKLKLKSSEGHGEEDAEARQDDGIFWLEDEDTVVLRVTHFCGFVCTHCGGSSPQVQLRLYGSRCGQDGNSVSIFLLVWDKRLDCKDLRADILKLLDEQKFITSQSLDVPSDIDGLKLGMRLFMEPQYEQLWTHKLRPDDGRPFYAAKQTIDLKRYNPGCSKSSAKRVNWLVQREPGGQSELDFQSFIDVGYTSASDPSFMLLDCHDSHTLHIPEIELPARRLHALCVGEDAEQQMTAYDRLHRTGVKTVVTDDSSQGSQLLPLSVAHKAAAVRQPQSGATPNAAPGSSGSITYNVHNNVHIKKVCGQVGIAPQHGLPIPGACGMGLPSAEPNNSNWEHITGGDDLPADVSPDDHPPVPVFDDAMREKALSSLSTCSRGLPVNMQESSVTPDSACGPPDHLQQGALPPLTAGPPAAGHKVFPCTYPVACSQGASDD